MSDAIYVPNREKAVVPEFKITRYLLGVTHLDGGGKAHFLIAHGFSPDRPD